jgi:Lon protease-like protein
LLLKNLFSAGRRRETVPIFPLQTVLYPGSLLPLRIFEVRYMDMAKACLRDGSPFGVCLIKEGLEVGAPAVPEKVGCIARRHLLDLGQPEDGPPPLREAAEGGRHE